MGDVDDARARRETQDDAFHGPDEVIGEAKIGSKRNQTRWH